MSTGNGAGDKRDPLVGERLSHFLLEERTGSSPLGPIYRALDERLSRVVAIQILDGPVLDQPEARARFRSRVQALAKLDHPHIGKVFEFAEANARAFVVMELVGGRLLSERMREGPLGPAEAARVGAEIAEALGAAHAAGIIHQALAPHRVHLTEDGHVKVTGFESIRLGRDAPAGSQAGDETQSVSAWDLAPSGAPPVSADDPRSDVYGVGALLQQMLAESRAENSEQYSDGGSGRGEASDMLSAVIRKALEEDPDRRYQSTSELRDALVAVESHESIPSSLQRQPLGRRLYWIGGALLLVLAVAVAGTYFATRSRGIESVAILGFTNASGDRAAGRALDEVADRLARDLAGLGRLKVIGPATAGRLLRSANDPRKVGDELGVQAVVTGRTQRRGLRWMLGVELIDTRDRGLLWGGRYPLDPTNVAGLARQVSLALRSRLRPGASGRASQEARAVKLDVQTRRLFLKANQLLAQPEPRRLEQALTFLRQATERNPRYAPAYVAKAHAYHELADLRSPAEMMKKARAAAERALRLEPKMGGALAALAMARDAFAGRWEVAKRLLDDARTRAPQDPYVRLYRGLVEGAHGRFPSALRELAKARELDPFSLRFSVASVWTRFFARQYEAAIRSARRLVVVNPDYAEAQLVLGWALCGAGRHAQALTVMRRARSLSPSVVTRGGIAAVLAASGREAAAKRLLREIEREVTDTPAQSLHLVPAYMRLGDTERALHHLGRAVGARSPSSAYVGVDPRLDRLRKDKRFQSLVAKLGLAPRGANR